MNQTMNGEEVRLAMRIIGLRGTSMKAKRQHWQYRYHKDREHLMSLQTKGHVEGVGNESKWILTNKGIQQLKLQIGEFTFC